MGLGWGALPWINGSYYRNYGTSIIYLSIFAGVMFVINSTIFDLKDIQGDSANNIITWPVKFGVLKTKAFCCLLNFSLCLMSLVLFFCKIVPDYSLFLVLMNFYVFIYIFKAKTHNSALFYGIFVDGEFIFAAVLLSLIGNIMHH